MVDVRRYVTESGTDVIGEWLAALRDARARAKVAARIARLAVGNFGDCKPIRDGVWELRVDWGPGYRVYYAMLERTCVLLLCGGDKRKQASDIKRAIEYWEDYQRRMST
jgi:putative addiction module killer protein